MGLLCGASVGAHWWQIDQSGTPRQQPWNAVIGRLDVMTSLISISTFAAPLETDFRLRSVPSIAGVPTIGYRLRASRKCRHLWHSNLRAGETTYVNLSALGSFLRSSPSHPSSRTTSSGPQNVFLPASAYKYAAMGGDKEEASKPEHQRNGSASDEEKDSGPPPPVNFFHSGLKDVRREVYRKWALTTTILMAFILAVMSIYWGSLFHVEKNLKRLSIAVVDFDGLVAPYNTSGTAPVFGPAIVHMANAQIASGKPTLGWKTLTASDFNFDPIQVRQAVYNNKYWGAIIINANATVEATNAVNAGDASYDPSGAAQLIYVQARDQTTWDSYIYPFVSEFLMNVQSEVGAQWAKSVLKNAATNTTLRNNLVSAPSALSPGISFASFNLRPFYPFQITPSVTVGLIYLIIVSFFSFSFYLPVYTKLIKPDGHPPLKFWQMVFIRYIGIQGAYLFLSLAYSLVSLAFQVDFSSPNPVHSDTMVTATTGGASNAPKFGAATFMVFWTINYVGMMALGFACENVAMIVGQPWTGLWLIFWVITNVATSFYNLDVEPNFFHWGYAWPLHHVVQATRTVLFDLHNDLGLNFGILLAWTVVNTALFPVCCRFMKYKNTHHVKEYWA